MRVRESGSIVVPHRSRPQQRKVPASTIAQRAAVAGVQAVNRPSPHQAKVNRAGSFAFNPRASVPIRREQHHAQTRTRRADQKAPARPYPVVPPLRNPTPRQAQAAQQLARRSLQGQLPRNPTVADQQRVIRQLQNDPRTAHLVQNLARLATSHATVPTVYNPRAHEGRAPRRLSAGIGPSINLDAVARTVGTKLAGNPIAATAKGLAALASVRPFSDGSAIGRSANDIQSLTTGLIPTVYLGATHPAQAAKGIVSGTVDSIIHPTQHPVYTLATLLGGYGAVGRGGGALARGIGSTVDSGGLRGALAKAGTQQRAPLAIGGPTHDRLLQLRRASPNVITAAAQRRLDRRLADGPQVTDPITGKTVTAKLTREGRNRAVRSVQAIGYNDVTGRLQRRGDVEAEQANAVERQNRAVIAHDIIKALPVRDRRKIIGAPGHALDRSLPAQPRGNRRILPKGAYRPEKDILGMVVEGTITGAHNFKRDLEAELRRVKDRAKHSFDDPNERDANLQRQRTIERVLNDPKALANAKNVVESGRKLAQMSRDFTQRAVDQGALTPEAAARSPLIPFVLSGAGQQHFPGARHFTVEDHAAAEKQALRVERATAEGVRAFRELKGRDPHVVSAEWTKRADTLEAKAAGEANDRKAAGMQREAATLRTRVTALNSGHTQQTLEQANRAARARRIAVSGKHPGQVQAHEAAIVSREQARTSMKEAQARHTRAERALTRVKEAQARARDAEVAPRMRAAQDAPTRGRGVTAYIDQATQVHDAAAVAARQTKYAAARAHAEAEVKAANTARRNAEKHFNEQKRQVPAAPKATAALRKGTGEQLTNNEIHAAMQKEGIPFDQHGPIVGYLPHRPDVNGRGSYHRANALLRRENLEGFHRTGAAFSKGITGSGAELIADHLTRQAIVTGEGALGQFDRLVHEAGVRHKDGSLFTPADAENAAKNLNATPGQPPLIPVRVFNSKMDADRRFLVREQLQSPASLNVDALTLDGYVEQGFKSRLDMAGPGSPNVALMPEALVTRLQDHATTLSQSKLSPLVASAFRTSVLPFSTKWLTGNVLEAALRLAVIGANPADYAAGRKVIRSLRGRETEAQFQQRTGRPSTRAERRRGDVVPRNPLGRTMLKEIVGLDAQRAGTSTEVRAALLNGLFYGNAGSTIHVGANRFEGTRMQTPAEMIGGLGQTPVLHETGMILKQIPASIFRLNRGLEHQAQIVALGRFTRQQIQDFTGSWTQTIRLQKQAVDQAARGHFNTATQQAAAAFMDETLGKYSRFSPGTRRFIQTLAPFLPWYLNAARFVFWTMPVKHPVKQALLAQTAHTFEQDWKDQHKGLSPQQRRGSLYGTIPSKGGYIDAARFTPYGLPGPILAGDVGQLTSPLLPQAQGAINALRGLDPFGRPLQAPKTTDNPQGTVGPGRQVGVFFNQLAEGFIPGVAWGRRLREGGGTAYSTSSILHPQAKPGTSHMSAPAKVFNPFARTYVNKGSSVTHAPAKGSGGTHLPVIDLHELNKARGGASSMNGPKIDLGSLNRYR